jgi:hypothetical protein
MIETRRHDILSVRNERGEDPRARRGRLSERRLEQHQEVNGARRAQRELDGGDCPARVADHVEALDPELADDEHARLRLPHQRLERAGDVAAVDQDDRRARPLHPVLESAGSVHLCSSDGRPEIRDGETEQHHDEARRCTTSTPRPHYQLCPRAA